MAVAQKKEVPKLVALVSGKTWTKTCGLLSDRLILSHAHLTTSIAFFRLLPKMVPKMAPTCRCRCQVALGRMSATYGLGFFGGTLATAWAAQRLTPRQIAWAAVALEARGDEVGSGEGGRRGSRGNQEEPRGTKKNQEEPRRTRE